MFSNVYYAIISAINADLIKHISRIRFIIPDEIVELIPRSIILTIRMPACTIPPEILAIKAMFYLVFKDLIKNGAIKNLNWFAKNYGVVRSNLYAVETNDSRSVNVGWLYILIRHYNVSAQWLFTGKGRKYVG